MKCGYIDAGTHTFPKAPRPSMNSEPSSLMQMEMSSGAMTQSGRVSPLEEAIDCSEGRLLLAGAGALLPVAPLHERMRSS